MGVFADQEYSGIARSFSPRCSYMIQVPFVAPVSEPEFGQDFVR